MNSNEKEVSRRQLLSGVGALSGALIISRIAGAAQEEDKNNEGKATKVGDDQLVLRLNDNPELGKVGGFKIFDLGDDRVIVANTDKGMVARSAVCTHKGCDVEYRADVHQFVCPCHGARHDEDGKVVRGPARVDLKKYAGDSAFLVSKG